MFYTLRLLSFRRTDCKGDRRETAGEYHRYAHTYALVETEGHQTGMGAWPHGFSHSQSRFFLRAPRRGPDALFRLDKCGNSAYCLGHTLEHNHRAYYHRADSSDSEQGREQVAREKTYKKTRMTQNMKDIITNEYFMLALTFGVY